MYWVAWLSAPLIVFGLWLYTVYISRSFPTLRNKRICLLIAHPDDEAMFFAPTVIALTEPSLGNHVKVLCLSSGDADGLGQTRKKELVKSAMTLGIKDESDILVIEDENFPDSMTASWDSKLISNLLTATFAPKTASIPSSKAPEATMDVLITFDGYGVSNHPNHRALYHGSVSFLKALMSRHSGWDCPISLYTLTSLSLLRKYGSVFDAPATMLSLLLKRKEQGEKPTPLLFASGLTEYQKARNAMVNGHRSQMVWFRWGWITLGRYMVINDLRKERCV